MKNVELQKNIWLEMSPARMVIVPILYALIFTLTFYISRYTGGEWHETFSITALFLMGFVLIIGGTRQSSETIINEVNDRTWLSQKLIPISALDMTVGKLFGSTIFIWYNAAILIGIYLFSIAFGDNVFADIMRLLVVLTGAVIGHSIAMMISLQVVRNNPYAKKLKKNNGFIIGVITGYLLVVHTDTSWGVNWYSLDLSLFSSLLMRNFFLLTWALIGLYRMMRLELQFDNRPFVLPIFILTMGVYSAGYSFSIYNNVSRIDLVILYSTYITSLIVFAYAVLTDTINPVALRKIADRWRKGDINTVLTQIPLWLVSFITTTVITVVLTTYSAGLALLESNSLWEAGYNDGVVSLLPVTIYLFIIRDLLVIMIIKGTVNKWAEFFSAIYLALIYGIVPGIFAANDLIGICHIFWPMVSDNVYLVILPICVQVFLITGIVIFQKDRLLGLKTA